MGYDLRCSDAPMLRKKGLESRILGKQSVITALAVDIKIKNVKLKIKNAVAHF